MSDKDILKEQPGDENSAVPINVVRIMAEMREHTKFMRNALLVVVACLAVSVGFNAWQNLKITDRSDKIANSNTKLVQTQVRQAAFDDVLRELILCKQDTTCVQDNLKKLADLPPVGQPTTTTTSTTTVPKVSGPEGL